MAVKAPASHPSEDAYWEGPGLVRLMSGFLLGPLAWFLDLEASYAAVKWACAHDHRDLMLLVPVGSLALVGVAAWLSWSCWTLVRDRAREEGGSVEDRSYFLAIVGMAVNATFALLIATSLAPRYFLSPCE
jgi:hypothetical protein